eukprot:jgi/Chlat1/6043/Chrsp4S06212
MHANPSLGTYLAPAYRCGDSYTSNFYQAATAASYPYSSTVAQSPFTQGQLEVLHAQIHALRYIATGQRVSMQLPQALPIHPSDVRGEGGAGRSGPGPSSSQAPSASVLHDTLNAGSERVCPTRVRTFAHIAEGTPDLLFLKLCK